MVAKSVNNQFIKILFFSFLSILALSGVVLFRLSLLPLEEIKNIVEKLCLKGGFDVFIAPFFSGINIRLRLVGTIVLFICGFLILARRQFQTCISGVLDSFPFFFRQAFGSPVEIIRKEDKLHLGAFLAILITAVIIRLVFLFEPMRNDEAFTFVYYAWRSWFNCISFYSFPNNHIFHTLLVRSAYLLLGNHQWVIRLPAFIAGILLVPASYALVRKLYNKHAALLSAGFIGSCAYLIEYSVNARGYTLISLIFLVILLLSIHIKHNGTPAGWFFFIIFSSLGFYVIPVMLYPFGIVVAWFILSTGGASLKKLYLALASTAILIFLLYLPVFIFSGTELFFSNRFISPRPWLYFTDSISVAAGGIWRQWNRDIPQEVSFLLIIGFLVSLFMHRRTSSERVPVALAVFIWCIPVFLIQRVDVSSYDRVWLFLLPLYLGLASSGINYLIFLFANKIKVNLNLLIPLLSVFISIWLTLSVYYCGSIPFSEEVRKAGDVEQACRFLKNYRGMQDLVLVKLKFFEGDTSLGYYLLSDRVKFTNLNRPTEYLNSLPVSRRVIIIIQKDQGLDVLKAIKFSVNYSQPKLIRQYDFLKIYEMDSE